MSTHLSTHCVMATHMNSVCMSSDLNHSKNVLTKHTRQAPACMCVLHSGPARACDSHRPLEFPGVNSKAVSNACKCMGSLHQHTCTLRMEEASTHASWGPAERHLSSRPKEGDLWALWRHMHKALNACCLLHFEHLNSHDKGTLCSFTC